MTYDNRVSELSTLKIEVLQEVVREGELMLAAQLAVASAADQRAMTLAGLLIAGATASAGGVVAMLLGDSPNWNIALVGSAYAAAAITIAGFALWSARPGRFSFPGNEPASWHPEQWQIGALGPHTIHQARVEQAVNLQSQIKKNQRIQARNALWLRISLLLAFLATVLAAVAIGLWGAHRWQSTASKDKHEEKPICRSEVNNFFVNDTTNHKGLENQPLQTRKNVRTFTHAIRRGERTSRLPAEPACKPSHPASGA